MLTTYISEMFHDNVTAYAMMLVREESAHSGLTKDPWPNFVGASTSFSP